MNFDGIDEAVTFQSHAWTTVALVFRSIAGISAGPIKISLLGGLVT